MTETALWTGLVLQAVLIVGLSICIFLLVRQLRVLSRMIHPAGALTLPGGPGVGDSVAQMQIPSLAGRAQTVGGVQGRSSLIFFVSPTCPICRTMVPVVQAVAASETNLDVIIASDGDEDQQRHFAAQTSCDLGRYILSEDLGQAYGIGRVPQAVLLRPDGRIAARGLVNNREHVESLLTAAALDVVSIQDYMTRKMQA